MNIRLFRRLTSLLLACVLLILGGCANPALAKINMLVKGNLDVIYRGVYSPEYQELLNCDEAQLKQDYINALETEARFFAEYWGIVETDQGESYDNLEAGLQQEIIRLLGEIYRQSEYDVQDVTKEDDGYTVTIMVKPIDIMEKAVRLYDEDEYEPLNQFWIRRSTTDFTQMSQEEYQTYTHEYGQLIVDLVRDLLPSLGYREPEILTLKLLTREGVHSIREEDWIALDTYMIFYP